MGASWISRKGRILQNGGGWGGEGVDLEKGGGGGYASMVLGSVF